jgi:tRNA(adenine34) deaminase
MEEGTEARDLRMIARCIELSRSAISEGENPFACIICRDDDIIVEATTRAKRDADISRHAELIALSEAQKKLRTSKLSDCTIYSNIEPCAMCSYCIRETGIGRVVYCLPSPIMGGLSKWNILGDSEVSNVLPEIFRKPPQVVSGLMEAEAEQVWREWHPFDWAILKHRHAMGKVPPAGTGIEETIPRKQRPWARLLSWLKRATTGQST